MVAVQSLERRFEPEQLSPGRRLRLRRVRRDRLAASLIASLAETRGVPLEDLLQRTRGTAPAAETRLIAMYLVHTLLGRTQLSVSRLFGRDRSTVAHACQVIEDRRDDKAFDAYLGELEMRLGTALIGERRDAA